MLNIRDENKKLQWPRSSLNMKEEHIFEETPINKFVRGVDLKLHCNGEWSLSVFDDVSKIAGSGAMASLWMFLTRPYRDRPMRQYRFVASQSLSFGIWRLLL